MIGQNEIEQIIRLIHKGYNLKLLSFELNIPLEQIQACSKQLELRRLAKTSIEEGKIPIAIEQLNNFIANADNSIVERTILLKLQAYSNGTDIDKELAKISEERKASVFSKDVEELLKELELQIPKRKNSNMKKRKQAVVEKEDRFQEETDSMGCKQETEQKVEHDYEQVIKKYKEEIARNPKSSLNKRNLLAFAYFRSGRIDEARNELLSLIDEYGNYTAYRQLIYLEKSQGNFEEARMWAEDCLEQFPNNLDIRHQLVSVEIEANNYGEAIKQLKKIISINPENRKGRKTLARLDAEKLR